MNFCLKCKLSAEKLTDARRGGDIRGNIAAWRARGELVRRLEMSTSWVCVDAPWRNAVQVED